MAVLEKVVKSRALIEFKNIRKVLHGKVLITLFARMPFVKVMVELC